MVLKVIKQAEKEIEAGKRDEARNLLIKAYKEAEDLLDRAIPLEVRNLQSLISSIKGATDAISKGISIPNEKTWIENLLRLAKMINFDELNEMAEERE